MEVNIILSNVFLQISSKHQIMHQSIGIVGKWQISYTCMHVRVPVVSQEVCFVKSYFYIGLNIRGNHHDWMSRTRGFLCQCTVSHSGRACVLDRYTYYLGYAKLYFCHTHFMMGYGNYNMHTCRGNLSFTFYTYSLIHYLVLLKRCKGKRYSE